MPSVFGELHSWYHSYRRIRGDGNCYFRSHLYCIVQIFVYVYVIYNNGGNLFFFRAIVFRALEYFMQGCDATSKERRKVFFILIHNFRQLEFSLEEHQVRVNNKYSKKKI